MPEQTAKNTKRVLLINDLAGYGKVALSAMIPVFSHLRYDTCNLPTALVSTRWTMVTFAFWTPPTICRIRWPYGQS